jgi:hypothetical protein
MTSYWVLTAATIAATFALFRLIRWTKNKILVGLLGSAMFTVYLLWLFYGNFGVINLYIFCVSFFFDFVFLSPGLWEYAQGRRSRDDSDTSKNLRDDWLAVITVVGLLFFYIGPVVGWGLSDLAGETNWRALYTSRVVLAIILPAVSALVLLPFLFRRALLFYVPVVLLLAALPVWSGWNAALDLSDGPRFQIIRHGCYSDPDASADLERCLCGGREISCDRAEKDEEIFMLPHTRRVLRAAESNVPPAPGERKELRIGTPGFPKGVTRGELRAKFFPTK